MKSLQHNLSDLSRLLNMRAKPVALAELFQAVNSFFQPAVVVIAPRGRERLRNRAR